MFKRLLGALALLAFLVASSSAFAGGVTVALAATGTSALLLPSNSFRHFLLVQNLSHTTSVFCSVGQTATGATTTNGFEIAAGGNLMLFTPAASSAGAQGITNDVECITAGSTINVVALEG